MAQELSEKDLLKMNVEQLKKEVKNTRVPVSLVFPPLPLSSSPPQPGPFGAGTPGRRDRRWGGWCRRGRTQREAGGQPHGGGQERGPRPGGPPQLRPAPLGGKNSPPPAPACPFGLFPLQPLSPPCPGPVYLDRANHGSRQTNKDSRATLCFLTDFQDGKGNQGFCGG